MLVYTDGARTWELWWGKKKGANGDRKEGERERCGRGRHGGRTGREEENDG